MKRLVLLLAFAFLPSAAAHADGCPPSSCGTATIALPGADVLPVRTNGSTGPLTGYDLASGRARFALPAGLLSADGRRFLSARTGPVDTTLQRYDARTGRLAAVWSIHGRWWPTGLSADGHWLALKLTQKGRVKTTTLGIVDTLRGDLRRTITLRGNLQAEAVSRDAQRLFLVHYLRRGYRVESLDVATRRLAVLRAKTDPAIMGGIAWSAVPSVDGRWLLTLYLDPTAEGAAIHTLDLVRNRAICVDLPSGDFQSMTAYALVPSRDGLVYAANPQLGVVATVDLRTLRVVSKVRFQPGSVQNSLTSGPTGALSPSWQTLYFSSGRGLWAYDTVAAKVRGPYATYGRVAGLGFTPDGKRLRVVRVDGRVLTYDAATGRRL